MTAILGAIHSADVEAQTWQAWADGVPLGWLPVDFYAPPVGPTCYDDKHPEDTK